MATASAELYFAVLGVEKDQLSWVHAKPHPVVNGPSAASAPQMPQAALRVCRRLRREHNLLASPLHDDGASFYVVYRAGASTLATRDGGGPTPTLSYGQVVQILTDLGCAVLDSSEAGEGVPTVVMECALRLALRDHLAQRGWFGVDACTYVHSPDPASFPPHSDSSVLVDAVDLNRHRFFREELAQLPAAKDAYLLHARFLHFVKECQLSGDGSVCLSLEGSVRRMTPFKLSALTEEKFAEDQGGLEDEQALAGCVVLPSLNSGGVERVSVDLPEGGARKLFSAEEDFRKYWSEVYGYILPRSLRGWAKVNVGGSVNPITYPLCCLLASELTVNSAQTRKRKGEIVQAILAELKDVAIGLQRGGSCLLQFKDDRLRPRYATTEWTKCSKLIVQQQDIARDGVPVNTLVGEELAILQPVRPAPVLTTARTTISIVSPEPLKVDATPSSAAKTGRLEGRITRKLGVKRPKPMDAATISAKGKPIGERKAKKARTTSEKATGRKSRSGAIASKEE